MKLENLNTWDLTPAEAVGLQRRLAGKVRGGKLPLAACILGLDVSYRRELKEFTASAVLLSLPGLEVLDSRYRTGTSTFPYVPGLLSFREIPPLLPILKEMAAPDIIMVDGQGTAHPRGCGLASHIGLITGVPTIGCAKNLLVGETANPGPDPGDFAPLLIDGRTAGFVLRSKKGCKPLYISPGNLLDPEEALKGVMMCLNGYRLPEPTRLADRLSKGKEFRGKGQG